MADLSILLDQASRDALEVLSTELAATPNNLVAFAGAGLSRRAGLPLWSEVMKQMDEQVQEIRPRTRQERDGLLSHSDLLWQAEALRMDLERRARYLTFLRRTFRAGRSDLAIQQFVTLNFRHFLTTNYDSLLEEALRLSGIHYEECSWSSREETRDFFLNYLQPKAAPYVIHLHGVASQPETIVLSYRDYVRQYVQTVEYVEKLSLLFATLRIVFVGFSLSDPDLNYILRQVNVRLGAGDVQHFALIGCAADDHSLLGLSHDRERLRRVFGIEPIFYDNRNGHAALADVISHMRTVAQVASAAETITDAVTATVSLLTHLGPALKSAAPSAKAAPGAADDDPHKGRFGGSPVSPDGSRRLSATVKPKAGYYEVALRVEGTGGSPLEGTVYFHVHPTFPQPVYDREAVDNAAELRLLAYGAFTVGVECDNRATRLELDLADPSLDFPSDFQTA